ncbi:DNA-processing protein DprA [Microbacterium sp.]|uniref:DNA-processing protein DprA n=1 Tax=Microbacterium sp. TaxID=51671 RepID=UPI003C7937E0
MSALDVDGMGARRALAGIADDLSDGDDLVVAHARAVWSCLVEPGDRIAGALIAALGPVRALEVAVASRGSGDEAARAGVELAELAKARERWHPRGGDAPERLATARRAGARIVTPEDHAWPRRLDDLGPFAPVCLWVLGDTAPLGSADPAVALVGARASSAYGNFVAEDLAAGAAAAGIAVVSGAAYGIDGAAHGGALAAGGVTIALLAGGVERPYPAGHRDLLERIAARGVVAAEVPCGASPTKWRFLARNRLIAAMTDATVVVEAAWRSGALNTAHHAAALGRPLGAVPGAVTSATSAGCHRLLREAQAECITGIADMCELLGLGAGLELDGSTGADGAVGEGGGNVVGGVARRGADDRTRLLDALSERSARTTLDIARRAGLGPDDVAILLGLLELDGVAERRSGGWVRTKPPKTAPLW